jgi:uncharacterized RDD family membrane protein YckC
MTNGLANRPSDGDPALCEQTDAATEPVASEANVAPSVAPNPVPGVGPNIVPRVFPSVVPNIIPNIVSDLAPNLNPIADPNSGLSGHLSVDSWRTEVATRLTRYRTRRKPQTPRYPSLLLPFDAPESWSRSINPSGSPAIAAMPDEQDFIFERTRPAGDKLTGGLTVPGGTDIAASLRLLPQSGEEGLEHSAKVIEFPRSAAIPVFRGSELADPIFDRPRIVEAPEILPAPPALGGMLIEPVHQGSPAKGTGSDFPVSRQSASMSRRALAALVDSVILGTALAAFAAVVLRLNSTLNTNLSLVRQPLPIAAALSITTILLWAVYEFLFVVYTGSTPGLRIARLRLAGFDGSTPNRRLRRWRVLASLLSAFSAGLGYLWCVIDQDGLCWHDRITHTHVESGARAD